MSSLYGNWRFCSRLRPVRFCRAGRYLISRDAFSGYVSIMQMTCAFSTATLLVAGRLYVPWWFVSRIAALSGSLVMTFGLVREYMHLYAEREEGEQELSRRNAVLQAITAIFQEALKCKTEEELSQTCLKVAKEITFSEVGFVAEVAPDGCLRDLATFDLDSGPCLLRKKERRLPDNYNLPGLYERLLRESIGFLTNSPERPDETVSEPLPLTALLGVPLVHHSRTMGIISVGKREGSYTQKELESLESLAPAIVEALRRARAETALRRAEQEWERTFNTVPDLIAIVDQHCRIVRINQALAERLGTTAEACVGATCFGCLHGTSEPPETCPHALTMRDGKEHVAEIHERFLDGDFVVSTTPMFDERGEMAGVVHVARDITERKRAEEALLRNEKLATVGRMAASIAHEINNPLEAVMNTLYLAKSCLGENELARQYLDIADEELNRVSHITRQTLGFYRESSDPTPVSVATVVDSAVDLLRSKIRGKNAEIRKKYSGHPLATAVPGELRQIFSNLLANSLDAIDDKGTIALRVSRSTCVNNGQARIRITIADNGKGISASTLPHIFAPLFTTKEVTGSGLGLWVSKQLVDKHHGSIRVRTRTSGKRRGTTFSVLIPAGMERATEARV